MCENAVCEARPCENEKPKITDKGKKIHQVVYECMSMARETKTLLFGISDNTLSAAKEITCLDEELLEIWNDLCELRGILQDVLGKL